MSTSPSIQERNQELARRINEEALRDPQSPYAGKFVGIVDGRIVVVADTLEEMALRLRESGADPSRTFGIEAGFDYDTPIEIWTVR